MRLPAEHRPENVTNWSPCSVDIGAQKDAGTIGRAAFVQMWSFFLGKALDEK